MSTEDADRTWHPGGNPLELLFEHVGLAKFELPAPLVSAYGGALGFSRPRVLANFVASVDGVVALSDRGESGGIISGGSEADRFVMGLLRACADAVLVGAGTFRKDSHSLFDAESIYPAAAAWFAEARRRLGLAPRPKFVMISGSGVIDAMGPALEDAIVVTTTRGEAVLRSRVPSTARVVALAPDTVPLSHLIAFLQREGLSVVLNEGGPTLFAELVAAKLLDELFVTTSPALFGRFAGDGRKSLAEGCDLAGIPLELLSMRRHGSHLFSRYAISIQNKAP